MPVKNPKAIAWQDQNGEWHILPKGDKGAPGIETTEGFQHTRTANAIFELDVDEARGMSLKNRYSAPFDKQMADLVFNCLREMERAYSTLSVVHRKLKDEPHKEYPTNVSQAMAQIFSYQSEPKTLGELKLQMESHNLEPSKHPFFSIAEQYLPKRIPDMGTGYSRSFKKDEAVKLLKADYSKIENHFFAKALHDMGLAEWFHELLEMVHFPDVEDTLHLRNTIREHLDDDRVKFLRAEASASGDSSSSEEDDPR